MFTRLTGVATALLIVSCTFSCAEDETGREGTTPAAISQPADPSTAGPRTGDLFATGTVRDENGPVRGASVSVVLWPESDDAVVGERVELWSTLPVSSDARGRWWVRLDAATIPDQYLPASRDYLNFELKLSAGTVSTSWNTTVHRVGAREVWRTDGGRPDDQVLDVAFDLGAGRITLTSSDGRVETSALAHMDTAAG